MPAPSETCAYRNVPAAFVVAFPHHLHRLGALGILMSIPVLAVGCIAGTEEEVTLIDDKVPDDVALDFELNAEGVAQAPVHPVVVPAEPPDGVPSGFVVSGITDTGAQTTWTDTSTNEEGFLLERWGGESTSWTEHVKTEADTTSFTLGALLPETEYGFRVRAWNRHGLSGPSNERWFTTGTGTGGPVCGDGTSCGSDCGSCPANLVFADDFDYMDAFTNHGWRGGDTEKFFHERAGCLTDGCVRIHYDEGGTPPYWFGVKVESERMQDFTVRFYFRIDGAPALGGAKFLKIFGAGSSDNYANTTFPIRYESGRLRSLNYGPGDVSVNDAQAKINLDGRASDDSVEVLTATDEFIPQAGVWHEFRAYMRYSSDDMRDGEYRVWIDGELRLHARNIRNRHQSNAAYPRSIDLANYSDRRYREHAWDLWYDDIEIYRGLVTP